MSNLKLSLFLFLFSSSYFPPPISKIDPKSIPSQKRKSQKRRLRANAAGNFATNSLLFLAPLNFLFDRSNAVRSVLMCVFWTFLSLPLFLPLSLKASIERKKRTHEFFHSSSLSNSHDTTNRAKSEKNFFSIDGTFVHPPTQPGLASHFPFV